MALKSVLLAGAALVGTAFVPIQGAIAISKNAVAVNAAAPATNSGISLVKNFS